LLGEEGNPDKRLQEETEKDREEVPKGVEFTLRGPNGGQGEKGGLKKGRGNLQKGDDS